MDVGPTDVEARLRTALKERCGETASISRMHRHNATIYLEVLGRAGLEHLARAIDQALESVGPFLREGKIGIEITISAPWQPRWQSRTTSVKKPARLDAMEKIDASL